MDIGQLRNNTVYYDGFDGGDEVIFEPEKDRDLDLHIRTGYLDDILRDPAFQAKDGAG